ncbi:uncharacterized protein LOC115370519 [Myripristis murdjan]|uniref:uncharacterized protein LOC115370519 n=1 Tax=Myripristis murdjan TaxID=586833 RepID=UPI0011763D2F|nr:uncharacterized protein LOC115370519 [Myripristis murdjan]
MLQKMSSTPWHPFRQLGCSLGGGVCSIVTISIIMVVPILWSLGSRAEEKELAPLTSEYNHTTADIHRRKRELFQDTQWKPWGFDANSVKYEKPEHLNSWWSFIRFLSKRAPGTGPMLVAYKPLGNWNPLFNLTTDYEGCTKEAVEFTGHVNMQNPRGRRQWAITKRGCKKLAAAYTNAMYSNNSPEKTLRCWYMLCEDSFDPQPWLDLENVTPVEITMQTPVSETLTCVCNNGTGQFMGQSQCDTHVTGQMVIQTYAKEGISLAVHDTADSNLTMNIGKTQVVANNSLRYHVGLGIGFMYSNYWQCGNNTYEMLPINWNGCCYLVKLKVHNVMIMRGQESHLNRNKRALAQFHNIQSYHWRISLGEKWGIGILPWYGVTFLADHIDNITYTMSAFANETIKGFEYLSANDKSHRMTLLKHEMALDFLMARTGGLCITLNLTGDACNYSNRFSNRFMVFIGSGNVSGLQQLLTTSQVMMQQKWNSLT